MLSASQRTNRVPQSIGRHKERGANSKAFGGHPVSKDGSSRAALRKQEGDPANEQEGRQTLLSLPPEWRSFLSFCERLGNGEIHELKIQDGHPVIAQAVTPRIRFLP
jgi:hypothetical protein